MAGAKDSLASEVAAAAATPENRCGDYVLLQVLGEGGSAVVFRAWDTIRERQVALKLIEEPDAEARARFKREVALTRSLGHPGIVALLDSGEDGERLFLICELIEGDSLADRARGKVSRDVKQATRWIYEAALAVAFAHERGVLHRDIKPHNIAIGEDGRARVLDFGLARLLEREGDVTRSGATVGTLAFMPPEQIGAGRAPLDVRCDVYALGATLYYVLTGQPPFHTGSRDELLGLVLGRPAPAPSALNVDVPPAIDAVCERALQKDPQARQQTALAFAHELGSWLGEDVPAPAEGSTAAGRLRVVLGVLVTLSVLVAGALIAAIAARSTSPDPSVTTATEVEVESAELRVLRAFLDRVEARGAAGALPAKTPPGAEAVLAERIEAATAILRRVEREAYERLADPSSDPLPATEALARRDRGALDAEARATLAAVERRLTVRALKGLRLRSARSLIAERQAKTLGEGRAAALSAACTLLLRGEVSQRGRAALAGYLAAERDPLRAIPVALALCSLDHLEPVRAARRRFGAYGAFARNVESHLGPAEPADAAERTGNDEAAALLNAGRVLTQEGRTEDARAALDRAIALDPTLPEIWVARGELRQAVADLDGAEFDFRQALAVDSRTPEAHAGLGRVLSARGRSEDAKSAFDQAKALDPTIETHAEPTPARQR